MAFKKSRMVRSAGFRRDGEAHPRTGANAGITGPDVRDIMPEAVETRFDALRAAPGVEMLSDNGSTYAASVRAERKRKPLAD